MEPISSSSLFGTKILWVFPSAVFSNRVDTITLPVGGQLSYAVLRERVSKTAVMNVMGFLCTSLGIRRARECSETGFSSQNVDHAQAQMLSRRAAFCYAFFVGRKTQCNGY
jgi:hypothetical protein